MANAVILFGAKVKAIFNVSAYTFNNKSGFATTLVINGIKYTHTFTQTSGNETINEGYYQETYFLQYLAKTLPAINLAAYVLDYNLLADAIKGDTVLVNKLKIVSPYADFCTVNQYTWAYDPSIAIIDVSGNIAIPSSATVAPLNVPLTPQTVYDFYNKNIQLITSSDFTDNRDDAAYSLALCALEIYRINRDIFPLFNQSPDLAAYIVTQNTEWASGDIFTQPTYEDILQYEESLANYYNVTYSNQLLIAAAPANDKVIWLASVLSPSGLAVFPIDQKLSLLSQILDVMTIDYATNSPYNPLQKLVPLGPQMILNLIAAITDVPTQADYFLNQLLVLKYTNLATNKDQLLFEALYNILTDNRIGTYTLGALSSNNNRKQFIQSIYDIWEISKFNPYYNSSDYTKPVNSNTGVYSEAFFVANKALYYNSKTSPAVLSYDSTSTSSTLYLVNFQYEFQSTQILAYKSETIHDKQDFSNTYTIPVLYGTYHIFQPLSIVGYAENAIVHLPQANCIPAFYLKYAYDAQAIQDFDLGVLDIGELALNLVLNFTGLGSAVEVGYLAEISGVAEASTLVENTPILTWDNFLGLNKTVMLTAGSFHAITQYIIDQSDNEDPNVIAFIKTLNTFLGAITLGAMTIDATAQLITAFSASNVKVAAAIISDDDSLSDDVEEEIEEFAPIDFIALMRKKISGLPLSENNIISRFDSLAQTEQLNFFHDFFKIDDDEVFWVNFNAPYSPDISLGLPDRILVDDWIEISRLKSERADMNFLTAYQRFKYLEPNEFKHLWILKGIKGGHHYINISEDLSDATLWKIVSDDPSINSTIPSNLRTTTTDVNGHKYYNNVWRYNSNLDLTKPSTYLVENLGVSKKAQFFVINNTWEEQDVLEEMAFGFKNRGAPVDSYPNTIQDNGKTVNITIEDYVSTFSDGTAVEIKISSQGIDIDGNVKQNYVSLFAVKDPNKP